MRIVLLTLLSLCVPLGIAQAALVLEYQTASSTTNPTLAPSFAAAEITGLNFAAGAGIVAASGSTYNFNNWDPANTSFAAAVAADEQFTFGFSVASNVTIQLSEFGIRLDRSGTGPDDFEIQASVNGGTGISLLTHNYNDSDAGVDFVGVSLAAVPTLVQNDSILFRIGAFNAEGTAGTFDLEMINFGGADPYSVRVNGTISAVPEPSSIALATLGLAALGWRRQRR